MTPFQVLLVGCVGAIVLVALVALRFPRGRADWPLDARRTAWLVVSGLTALAVFVLLYVATRDLRFPSVTASVFAATSLGLALLLAASLFLPAGLRARP